MVLQTQSPPMTAEEFDQFVMLPENIQRSFEYIGGEIREVVSNNRSSIIATRVISYVNPFALDNNLGEMTGADGGYIINGERYIPDAAYVSFAKQSQPTDATYSPVTPDLVIEALSPGNDDSEITRKVVNYLLVNAVVWVFDPLSKTVDVYIPGQPPRKLRVGDVLDGGDVLPGFKLPVAKIFRE